MRSQLKISAYLYDVRVWTSGNEENYRMKGTNLRTHVQLVTSLGINSLQKVAARNIYLTMSALTRSQKYWKAARTERYVLIGSWKILLWAFIFLKHYNERARAKWELLKFWKNEWIKKFQNTREITKFSPNRSQNFEFQFMDHCLTLKPIRRFHLPL